MSELRAAADALDAGDVEGALVHLLDAWRAHRAPEVAAAIEELGRLVPSRAAAGGKKRTAAAVRTELDARAAADDPADFEWLVAAPLPRSLDHASSWLRRLGERTADPRFASYVHRLLDAPPFGQNGFWRLAFELLGETDDPRSVDALEQLATRLPTIARPSALVYVERRRAEAHARLRDRWPAVPRLAPADADVLARIVAGLEQRRTTTRAQVATGDELLGAIRANPDDDRPRLIYADWLQERQDPRGELIVLQIAATDDPQQRDRRVRALVATHAKTWLGALAPIAVAAKTRFARGFPAGVVVNVRTGAQLEPAVGAPEWFSVEELAFSGPQTNHAACAAIVCHPVMASLRAVHGIGPQPAARIAKADPPLPITTLGMTGFEPAVDAIASCPGLPALERVVIARPAWIRGMADVVELLATPLARRLRAVIVETGTTRFELVADASGALSRLRVTIASPQRWEHQTVRDELAQLTENRAIGALELVLPDAPIDIDWLVGRLAQVVVR